MQIVLSLDRSFSRPGTWMPSADGLGIRARFRLGQVEYVVEPALRWIKPRRATGEERVHVHPVDAARTTWLCESSTFGAACPIRLTLQLNDADDHAVEVLKRL